MKIRFFDPAREYAALKPEIDAAMQDVLARGDLILRRDVEEFEDTFARLVGTRFAVGVASGTDALTLSLVALGIRGRVLVPSYTFRATVEAVVHAGCEPVLYDLGGPTPEDFTEDISAWVPAHIAGEVAPRFAARVKEVSRKGVVVIEDACQAVTAYPVVGVAACYSFYPAKMLGCCGDGGAIATDDGALAQKLSIMRNHFKGDWGPVGYNSRLDNLQAAVLNVKIRYLRKHLARRLEIAKMYDAGLRGVGLPARRLVYQDYIVTHPNRDGLQEYLAYWGIETMKNGYPFPAAYPKLPLAQAYEDRSLRLPCNPTLTDQEVGYVIAKVNSYEE